MSDGFDLSEIVLASGNPHKLEELEPIFTAALGGAVTLRSLGEFAPGSLIEPVEDGGSFEANARIKAISYAEQTGRACLADDSGLVIDALGSRPGVISSHYSTNGEETGLGRAERDRANTARVLQQLESVPADQRSARFVCVMALAVVEGGAGRVVEVVRGEFEGRIGEPPRVPAGANGFGYDPIFLVAPHFDRTGAELLPDEKNRLSHRAKAGAAMAARVRNRLG